MKFSIGDQIEEMHEYAMTNSEHISDSDNKLLKFLLEKQDKNYGIHALSILGILMAIQSKIEKKIVIENFNSFNLKLDKITLMQNEFVDQHEKLLSSSEEFRLQQKDKDSKKTKNKTKNLNKQFLELKFIDSKRFKFNIPQEIQGKILKFGIGNNFVGMINDKYKLSIIGNQTLKTDKMIKNIAFEVPQDNLFQDISCGQDHVLLLDNKMKTMAIGDNSFEQCSIPDDFLSNVGSIKAQGNHSSIIKIGGNATVFGDNRQNCNDISNNWIQRVKKIDLYDLNSIIYNQDGNIKIFGCYSNKQNQFLSHYTKNIKQVHICSSGNLIIVKKDGVLEDLMGEIIGQRDYVTVNQIHKNNIAVLNDYTQFDLDKEREYKFNLSNKLLYEFSSDWYVEQQNSDV